MTRKSPRRRSLRLKTRTPHSGVRTLEADDDEEKPKKKKSSSQDKNSSIGSKDTEADDDEEKPKKKKCFVSRQELLNRE
jgi:hypothetical protein